MRSSRVICQTANAATLTTTRGPLSRGLATRSTNSAFGFHSPRKYHHRNERFQHARGLITTAADAAIPVTPKSGVGGKYEFIDPQRPESFVTTAAGLAEVQTQ
jgi:hypothetical protein